MPLFQLVFSYFLGLLLSLLLFYVVGKAIRKVWAGSFSFQFFFSDMFFSLLVGQIALVFFYAIYHTKGLTIQWLFLLIAFFFWKERKEQKYDNQSFTLKSAAPKLLAIFIGIVFCFFWEAYFFIDTDGFPFRIPFIDTGFYNKVSYFLSVTGSENTANMENWLEGQPTGGISLYHYFELWLNNIITNSSGLLSMPTYVLITQPSFFCIGFVGILALLEQKAHFNFLHPFWAILLLFSSVVFFDFYLKIEKLQYIDIIFFHFLGHLSKKTGTYLVCMLAFALLFERKKYEQSFYVLFCLPIMTVTMLTSVVGGTWLFLVICLIMSYKNLFTLKKILFFSIFFLTAFIGLYQLIKNDEGAVFNVNNSFLSLISFNITNLLTKFKLFLGTLIQVGILFFPYLIVILLNKPIKDWQKIYTEDKEYIAASLSLLIAGLVSWVLFFSMNDAFQLFTGTLGFVQILMVLLTIRHTPILHFFGIKNMLINALIIILLGYNMSLQIKKQRYGYSNTGNYFNRGNSYSANYLKAIQNTLQTNAIHGFGCCLIDSTLLLKSPYPYQLSFHIIKIGDYLPLMTNRVQVVQMHDLDVSALESGKGTFLNVLPFYKFAKKQQQEGTFQGVAQSQIDFIKKYKLKFLILSKNISLDELFTPLIRETIVDESSGERFIILKNNGK